MAPREIETLPDAPPGKTGWPWVRPRRLLSLPWRRAGPPCITVVTPSFNQGKYLEETLRSVLLQGYPNLEYLVIDGGSSDDSVEILGRYAAHLNYWESEPDGGQAHAVNKGLARAGGEILGWLNSDDLLLPGSLWRIAAAFKRRRGVQVISGLRRVIDPRNVFVRNWVRDLPSAHYLRRYCCLAQETVYWRREVYERLGPLDESLHYALDYDYWLRMLAAGYELTPLPCYLGAYREHPESKSATMLDVHRDDLYRLYRRYGMGRNQEEVQMQLGEDWPFRLALLEDLCETRALDHGPAALGLLSLLERPGVTRRAVSLYRRYRGHRPRRSRKGGRLGAGLRAVAEELRRLPLPDAFEPHLARSNPLGRPLLTHREVAEIPVEELAVDALAVGEGWSWIEKTRDRVYRWADNDAEIVVTRPTGRCRRLEMHLESGPSLGWHGFPLEIRDEDDRVLLKRTVQPHDVVSVELPLSGNESFRCFRLRVPGTNTPASTEDPRVLNFRLTWLGWQESGALYDLPRGNGRPVQIALEPRDIVPAAAVQTIRQRRAQRDVPADGLFVGNGWLAPVQAQDEIYREAIGGSEIVVTGASREAAGLEIAAETVGNSSCVLKLAREDGRRVGEARLDGEPVELELPLAVGQTQVFRLDVEPDGASQDPPTCRVFRIAWRP